MSRLARKAIVIPSGMTVSYEHSCVSVKKGNKEASYHVPEAISLTIDDQGILCALPESKDRQSKEKKSLLGTTHVNIANMIHGVDQGFVVELQLVGIGYAAALNGNQLALTLGKSHQDVYEVPSDVTVVVPDKTNIVISGINKQRVYDVADHLVQFRRPDAYAGKGLRYKKRSYKFKEVKKK